MSPAVALQLNYAKYWEL